MPERVLTETPKYHYFHDDRCPPSTPSDTKFLFKTYDYSALRQVPRWPEPSDPSSSSTYGEQLPSLKNRVTQASSSSTGDSDGYETCTTTIAKTARTSTDDPGACENLYRRPRSVYNDRCRRPIPLPLLEHVPRLPRLP